MKYKKDAEAGILFCFVFILLLSVRLAGCNVKVIADVTSQETLIADYGRVRDVKVGPDGLLYVLLQNMNGDAKGGSIIRLVPAN